MAEQPRRTDLQDLVRDRRAELGISFATLESRCLDPVTREVTVKSSWLHRLESGEPTQAPQEPQLRGLAAGLDLPIAVVKRAAAAQYMGILPEEGSIWSSSREGQIHLARMEDLSPEERQAAAEMVEVFVRARRSRPANSQE